MDNLPSFAFYGVVLTVALASLFALAIAINKRAEEWEYYHQIASVRVDSNFEVSLCGGPGRTACNKGYDCKMRDGEVPPSIGKCELIKVK